MTISVSDRARVLLCAEARSWITEYPVDAVAKAGCLQRISSRRYAPGLDCFVPSTYLGCRVPQCLNQWFECGCHGSQYNRVGRRGWPGPEGMDHFPLEFSAAGVTVDTGTFVQGVPIGVNTTGQEAEGPPAWEQVTTNDRSNNHFNRMGASHRRDGGLHRVRVLNGRSTKNSGLKLSSHPTGSSMSTTKFSSRRLEMVQFVGVLLLIVIVIALPLYWYRTRTSSRCSRSSRRNLC